MPEPSQREATLPALELAQQLFKEYYASCFWHFKPDLAVTAAMIPWVVQCLFAQGGHQGMMATARLQEMEKIDHSCR